MPLSAPAGPSDPADFRPLPLLANPHVQTFLGAYLPGPAVREAWSGAGRDGRPPSRSGLRQISHVRLEQAMDGALDRLGGVVLLLVQRQAERLGQQATERGVHQLPGADA